MGILQTAISSVRVVKQDNGVGIIYMVKAVVVRSGDTEAGNSIARRERSVRGGRVNKVPAESESTLKAVTTSVDVSGGLDTSVQVAELSLNIG